MDPKTIRTRLQELAFLNSQATILFRALQPATSSPDSNGAAAAASHPESNGAAGSEEGGGWETLHFSGGLKEYVTFLNRDNQAMHDPIYITEKVSLLLHYVIFDCFQLSSQVFPNLTVESESLSS